MPKLGYEDIIESLDSEQKKAVTGMENTVISAGAGSGKTKVLASRYVHLIVKEKIPVENRLQQRCTAGFTGLWKIAGKKKQKSP